MRPLSAARVPTDTVQMTLHFRAMQPPTGLARLRPALTHPLSLDDCLRALKTICAATRAPTGGRPYGTPISESAEHGLTSTLRSALVHAAVDPADVRMALPDLPQHAAAAARARTHANPSEAASRARRALRLLTGIEPGARKLDAPHFFMSRGFADLQAFAHRRQDRSKLVILARTCAAMSAYEAPAVMPSIESLCAYAATDVSPYAANSVRNAASAYRRIRAAAVQTDATNATRFSQLDRRPHPRSRVSVSLRPDPHAEAFCSRARLTRLADRLKARYPSIAEELAMYLATPAAARVSGSWLTAVADAVARSVSLLDGLYGVTDVAIRVPAPDDVRLWHLYAVDVPLPGAAHAVGHAAFFGKVGAVKHASGPLIKRLLLADAPHARQASALGGLDPTSEQWIPEVCVRTECALWSVVTEVYAESMDEATWAVQVTRRRFVMEWLYDSTAGQAEREGTAIDKVWLVTHLSLPLLVTVGLTWMADRVRTARAAWQHRVAAHATRAVCETAYVDFAYLLHDYCALSIVCDDGMRRKNYANARHGRHVVTTYVEGQLVAVDLRFGTDRASDPACLKISERRRRAKRARKPVQPHVHRLSPTGVDHQLLDWWFREVAPGFSYQRPVCHGVLPPNASALQGLAVFPSAPRTARSVRTGDKFAERVHEALYAVIRLLHGDAVPPTRRALARAQRVACTLHRVRLLIGTYWGGARDDWTYAEHLTSDLKKTLEEHYSATISAVVMDQINGRPDDWRHPRHLDDLMDAIRERRDIVVENDPRVQMILRERVPLLPAEKGTPPVRRWRSRRVRRSA